VLDPSTGKLLLRNQLEIHNGHTREATQRSRPTNLLLAVERRLRNAKDMLEESLPSKVDSDEHAEEVRSRLAAVETALGQNTARDQSTSRMPRLHVVARYSSTHPVRVRVTDAKGPVTLVLCGHHRMDWSVEVAPGVKLDRILLAGHLPQTLINEPPNVHVETRTNERHLVFRDHRDRSKLRLLETRVQQLTGQSVSSFSMSHQSSGLLVLGPESATWRLQVAKHELDHLIEKLTRPTESQATATKQKLSALRFHAMHQGPLPRGVRSQRSSSFRNIQTRDAGVHWSEFSLQGPLIGRSVPAPQGTRFGVADSTKQWFCTGTFAKVSLSEGTQTARPAELLSNNQSVGHLAGIGFDEKRQRLLICGGRGLFACSLPGKQWSRLRSLNGLTRTGFAFSSEDEIAYAIRSRSRGAVHSIERFNANGVPLPPLQLAMPISFGSPYSYGYANVQLVALDGYLALLRYQHQHNQRLPGGGRVRRSPVGRLSIIELGEKLDDPGNVILETVVRPSLVFRKIPDHELKVMWEDLGNTTTSPDEIENELWLLAAGGESSLEFLKAKFRPENNPLSELLISELVAKLDDDSFDVRENAFRQLQASNSRIAPTLHAVVAENPSQEVRDRLNRILRTWKKGTPQSSHELRLVRAIDIISRVGTPDADEFLQSLVDPQYSSLIRFHAQQHLSTREDQPIKFENPALRLQQKLFVPRNPKD